MQACMPEKGHVDAAMTGLPIFHDCDENGYPICHLLGWSARTPPQKAHIELN